MRFAVSALACLALSATVFAQSWTDRWQATEAMIPMRDGTKLFTVYYVPKDKPGPFPILLERTPYGAGSAQRAPRRTSQLFENAGYIMAFQDVRGKGKSEGDWVNIRPILAKGAKGVDEASDTYDTVEYLIGSVPKNSRKVGLWGISYPGFYAGAGAVRNHPALAAVSPQAPVNDWFMGDDVHHRGVLFLQETFDFALGFDVPRGGTPPTVDRKGLSAYDFYLQAGAPSSFDAKFLKGSIPYWDELVVNDTYNKYWEDRALWKAFKDVNCAVLTVGGWFDKEDMYGALKLYSAGEVQNPKSNNYLVMGPWTHGGWAGPSGKAISEVVLGMPTSKWYQENIEFQFFERYLRGNTNVPEIAEATMFETGRNAWHRFAKWPPAGLGEKSLYLDKKALSWQKPKQPGSATYLANPMEPTPYVAGHTSAQRAPGDWLARDQKFLDGRSDTAVFELPALTEDLTIAGTITADLWLTTTGTDGDFVVQLIDEWPADSTEKSNSDKPMAGYQWMVRGEIMRAKFRSSWSKPSPMVPGKPTQVKFELNDALHTFRKGHKIKVRIMSSWFPIAERNPNVFLSRKNTKDADYREATIKILTGDKFASRLILNELPSALRQKTVVEIPSAG